MIYLAFYGLRGLFELLQFCTSDINAIVNIRQSLHQVTKGLTLQPLSARVDSAPSWMCFNDWATCYFEIGRGGGDGVICHVVYRFFLAILLSVSSDHYLADNQLKGKPYMIYFVSIRIREKGEYSIVINKFL